jgi:inosine-uridine nucleoside N-ribohydrolase
LASFLHTVRRFLLRRIVIDTDPGVDDALAIMLAFSSPELKVEAVTTVPGNVNQDKAHGNALKLLEFLGVEDTPIARGAEQPLLRKMRDAEDIHGESGLGDAVLPEPKLRSDPREAVKVILDKAEELGKKLNIVSIGPLTNIASAILAEPRLPKMIGGLVMMGGAYGLTPYGVGNVNAVAEFNVWHDPEAARIVFNSGIPIVAAGLDVTTYPDYRLPKARFEEMVKRGTRRAKLIGDLCGSMVKRFNGFSLHDPMAMSYAADPTMFKTERHRVDVETRGELTQGMTVIDRRSHHRTQAEANVEVIVSVDAPRFLDFVTRRVLGEG